MDEIVKGILEGNFLIRFKKIEYDVKIRGLSVEEALKLYTEFFDRITVEFKNGDCLIVRDEEDFLYAVKRLEREMGV
ncbi:MAG: hypothetical protein QXX95_02965 [Nitrososphaerales archaeon]